MTTSVIQVHLKANALTSAEVSQVTLNLLKIILKEDIIMQNFTKEQAKSATETTTANRGYWGYQEMTTEEIQQTTGAGCGGCGGCGGYDASLGCNIIGGLAGVGITVVSGSAVAGVIGGGIVVEACEILTSDNGSGGSPGRSEG